MALLFVHNPLAKPGFVVLPTDEILRTYFAEQESGPLGTNGS
jgi:hypothetical protein